MQTRLSGACGLLTIALAFGSLTATHALHAEPRWISHPAAASADAERASITLQFRREIRLTEQAKDFVVNVSADNRFVLYVNGQRVGAGPARGNLRQWRFETLDLSSYLVPGKNVLAAHVWNDGRAAPLAQISSGRTGFWLQAQDANRASLVETSEAWSVRVDGARTVSPGMPHMRAAIGAGFYAAAAPETIDGARLVADWASETSRAADWQPAVRADADAASARSLVPDKLPQMRLHRVPSGRVVRSSGIAAQGFPDRSIVVPANSQATLLVDAGRVLAAYPALKVSGGAGTEVRVTYVEALYEREMKAAGDKPATRVRQSDRAAVGQGLALGLTDTFKLDGSSQRFQPLWWRTWRFAEINVKTGAEPLTLEDFETWETGYPFERRGHFVSSDAELDAIWNVGWMTALLDAHETYMDTAYWEQLQYIGDTRIQMLLSYAVSGDSRLAVQALDTFDQSRSVEGLPQSAWPGVLKQVIPPFALLWVGALHDYWMRQPDTAVIVRTLPGTRAVFDEFERFVQPSGLVGPMPGWPFVDWKPGLDGWAERGTGILSCVISMQYVGALREGAELERNLGDAARGRQYTARADRTSRGVNSECWDEKRGLYADTPAKTTFSQHATVLAVLHDTAPSARHRPLLEKILVPGRGIDPPEGMTGTSYYFSFYLVQALDHAGLTDRYLDLLQPWRQMLRRNFTTWPETPDPSRSDTHAWASHPTHGLMEYVAGIRPDAPAFARVRVAPHLGALTKLDVTAVHPNGLIQTQYSLRGGELTAVIVLPEGVTGSFVWKGRAQPLKAGKNAITVRAQ